MTSGPGLNTSGSRFDTIGARLEISPAVANVIAYSGPVVALESTLISHGLPYPANLEVALAAEAAVRESDAVPATIAIRDGRILVGLTQDDLRTLATASPGSVLKAARPSLAAALDREGGAPTTVSATMIAAHAAGIAVFATGGIGGVHRGALGAPMLPGSPGSTGSTGSTGSHSRPTLDISSDLEEVARTPVAVICAGPKAILDAALTLEYLETRGVPVVTIGQDDLPGFYARSAGIRSPSSVPDGSSAARRVAAHLGLGLGSGILVCSPVPEAEALRDGLAREATDRAIGEANAAGIQGPDLTPWLLARVAELTDGASIRANTALILNNARVAGQLAGLLADRG
jgi:pseudouridine-5'-phosphate glycosidase